MPEKRQWWDYPWHRVSRRNGFVYVRSEWDDDDCPTYAVGTETQYLGQVTRLTPRMWGMWGGHGMARTRHQAAAFLHNIRRGV